jgi:phenylalanyl-tRNA synthetase beta chain
MKLSEKWLRTRIDVELDSRQLEDSLTLCGLEVDSVTQVCDPLPGVIVGKVEEVKRHPNAEKLSICLVSDGDASLQVVCGAANVRAGMKSALATPGALLPGNKVIKKTVIRGVESNGMLCSASELGIGEDSDGILDYPEDLSIGDELFEVLGLDDNIFDIDITPNRGDCFSLIGVARDLSAMTGGALKDFDIPEVVSTSSQVRHVDILSDSGCQNYVGRIIKGINLQTKTPIDISECLRRSGVRPINPVVDVTNFVMLELGQPMHAFDDNQINGAIEVRESSRGEAFHLLDGNELTLEEGSLVIADKDGPIALAGVMGGLGSSVTDQTTDIFLESAFFDPISLSGVARKYRMRTDASIRFERGVDPLMQRRAIERATAMIVEICGGDPGPLTCAASEENCYQAPIINFSPASVNRLVGITVSPERIIKLLEALEIQVRVEGDNWLVTPPSFRFDLREEADLVEEVARLEGYDNIPSRSPVGRLEPGLLDLDSLCERAARKLLAKKGYSEAITYSFISSDKCEYFLDEGPHLKLVNPISNEMEVMRPSILPGLLDVSIYNLNRQHNTVQVFEIGRVYRSGSEGVAEAKYLAGIRCGLSADSGWTSGRRELDFYDIKHDVEVLLAELGMTEVRFKANSPKGFHPTRTAEIWVGSDSKGFVGALSPALLDTIGIEKPVYAFEICIERLDAQKDKRYVPVSKYPSIRRDINIVLDVELEAQSLLDVVWANSDDILHDLQLLDVYQGQGIDSLKKSITLSLIFRNNSRTLTDLEIENACRIILSAIEKQLGGVLRE